MKLSTALVALSLVSCTAFVVPQAATRVQQQQVARGFVSASTTTQLCSSTETDFASAMPEKPSQTLAERLEESATQFISSLSEKLGDGVDPPPELEALKEARDSGASTEVMTARIYELMIEQGMLYDVDPETGIMTPTEWDIKENLEEPNVKKEFAMLCESFACVV